MGIFEEINFLNTRQNFFLNQTIQKISKSGY